MGALERCHWSRVHSPNHRKLDVEVPKLMELQADAEIADNVQDALDDINWYLRLQ
jgi:hypothetical protein